MNFYVNDLSLNGQFPDSKSFKSALVPLLKLRHNEPKFRENLYCSRLLYNRKVTRTQNLRDTVRDTQDKLFIGQVMSWFAKSGPFWDDHRQSVEDDYFEYEKYDVTDQGLGEAARNKIVRIKACVFSFQGGSIEFDKTPLLVKQGLPEETIREINIENNWTIEQLIDIVRKSKTYKTWTDIKQEIDRQFTGLIVSDNVIEHLSSMPFSKKVGFNVLERLAVLNDLVIESIGDGELSSNGTKILTDHFVGEKAWFSDESETNKNNFKKELTFPDPEDRQKRLFCPWHGKIKTPQIRIHFEWPRPKKQVKIKVVYIGPKITKN